MVRIVPQRLMADLHELRSFGATGTGVVRPAFSSVDIESRHWLVEKMTEIEEMLYQTKNQSRQDPLNFPIRLNNKLAAASRIAGFGDYRPTEPAIAVKDEMTAKIDAELATLQTIMDNDLPAFNKLVAEIAVPQIMY